MIKIKNFWNLKIFILAFEISLAFCFFMGIFVNNVRIENYNQGKYYYINRGFPISWAGVSKQFYSTDFPIVKVPFLTKEINSDFYVKIIDFSIFLPLFLVILIGNYFLIFNFVKKIKSKKIFKIVLFLNYIFWIIADIFLYFFWFPRI